MLKLLGLLLPMIIDTVNNLAWVKSDRQRMWNAFIIAAVFGLIVNFIESNGNYAGLTLLQIADSIGESVLAMIGISQFAFQAFWKQSDVRDSLGLNVQKNVDNE